MTGVTLSNVIKKYGETQVIHGIDLEIEDGEFCVFVGPSGCGKSTLLRMVAGLEETTGGTIEIGPRDVTHMDPAERGVAMVFQTYALYPHMTVAENMGFGLKMNRHPKDEIAAKVAEASRVLKLDDYLTRKPKALSGGQRQRVAIGRAIVRGPEVFLFDEPLSNLDAELRVEMRVEIARLHNEIGATMIYVTHDQVEAMTLADKIVVLRAGKIEQAGRPLDLYNDPDNQFVAGFIGSPAMNFIAGHSDGGDLILPGGAKIRTNLSRKADILVGIRPEHLVRNDADGAISMQVEVLEHLGGVTLLHGPLEGSDQQIVASLNGISVVEVGETVRFDAPERALHLFDPATEKRIEA